MENNGCNNFLAGRNTVREALQAGRAIDKIFMARSLQSLQPIKILAREKGIPVQEVDRARLDALAGGIEHQGVVAKTASFRYFSLEELISGNPSFLLLLDGLNDPQNLGAILRTADAAGIDGVVIPRHRSVGLTATVAKVSAGAVEYVPVARVGGIPATINELKKLGFFVVGADAEAGPSYWDVTFPGPLALVVGGEGHGLSHLAKSRCDLLVRIPMQGRISSLNASVAVALLAYEAVRQGLGGR